MKTKTAKKVVDRLDAINKMKSKYGATIEEIIEFRNSIAEKVEPFRRK